jgi:hypothetical protein
MCGPDHPAGPPSGPAGEPGRPRAAEASGAADCQPASVAEAVRVAVDALSWLAAADVASVPVSVQADCLRELERAASIHTAAHASLLSAFDAAAGYEDYGQGSPRTWLRWQTQVTGAAASASVRWMRRLRAHRAIAAALGDARISASWARQICDWTDRLPEDARDDADQILLAAAAGGAELADLARLAEEIRRRLAEPDDGDDGFEDRQVRLQTTLGGAGRLDGDLTPQCAAAVQAVLDALGKKAGPEDTRTQRQRHHDALEEGCRRLIASGCLPDRAGQPTQIQLHMTLDQLMRLNNPGNPPAPDPGSEQPSPAGTAHGPAARPGDACDATIIPIVTGHVDHDLLNKLTATLRRQRTIRVGQGGHGEGGHGREGGHGESLTDEVRELLLANAVALLSGPGQLASLLRTGALPPPAGTISLPLDLGTAAETIPHHLRRAVILRDRHCGAPGCYQPPSACHVHHTTPRGKGGRTKLSGLILLCAFHHLIVVHQWGWTITLNPDGTTTMRSPDGSRIYHSHSPPSGGAA